VDGELGPGVAGGDSARFPPDLLSPLGAVHEGGGSDGVGPQIVQEPEGSELAHGVGEQVDAHTERPQFVDRIEHVHLQPHLVQTERRCQSSDAGADDRGAPAGDPRPHRTSCTWMRTVLRSRSPVETATRSFSRLSRGAAVESLTSVRK
jgi:hypothetical protein